MGALGSRTAKVFLFAFAVLLGACNRSADEIKVYRLAKPSGEPAPMEKDAIASTNAPVRSTIERVPSANSNVATPPNWEPQPLSEMRQASFLVHGENGATADISFVRLGPAAGNVLDNVNRWLDQLGQPPVTPNKLSSMVQKVPTPLGEVNIVDLSGKPENGDASKDGRIVAAIASDGTNTSFYKMRGNAGVVGAEKENFIKWVVAMRSSSGEQTVAQSAPLTSDKPQIKWDIPFGWSPAPASAMRYASFSAEGKIDISVVTFPGDGGDDLGNVNRWRQQIGLAPTDESHNNIASLRASDATFSTIDITGANARTIAAWTRKDGRAWFFKITGSSSAVEKEKPNFVKFVQSVRF